jgi:large subunit ribosomal protein L9
MEVVLLQRIEKLGQMGDVVTVKPGYARNFLMPQGRALRATKANMVRFENERAQLEARNLDLRKEAEAVAEKLDGQTFVVIRSASEGGSLYGSVSPRDAAEAATEGGFSVDRKQVELVRPIKELGLHEMRVILHPEVAAIITINVARSVEEAEIQASGQSVQDVRDAEDAEADFDIAELFDDVGAAASEDEELVTDRSPIEDDDSEAEDQPRV